MLRVTVGIVIHLIGFVWRSTCIHVYESWITVDFFTIILFIVGTLVIFSPLVVKTDNARPSSFFLRSKKGTKWFLQSVLLFGGLVASLIGEIYGSDVANHKYLEYKVDQNPVTRNAIVDRITTREYIRKTAPATQDFAVLSYHYAGKRYTKMVKIDDEKLRSGEQVAIRFNKDDHSFMLIE
jgi:hypothetical protein